MKKLVIQFKNLRPSIRLLITLCLNFSFWFLFHSLSDKLWANDEQITWKEIIFRSTFMGIFWTILFNWKLIKQCFFTNAQQ
jgi:hypothetical protein